MRYFRFISILFFSFLFHGCNKSELDVRNYIEYIRDKKNNLSAEVEKNNYIFKVQYQSPEYLALKELKKETITTKKFNNELLKFKDYYYFDFSIRLLDPSKSIVNREDTFYESKLKYFSFEFGERIFLIHQNDTLNCLLYQFENTTNISPECHFEMMFDKKDLKEDSKLLFIYNDSILNIGKVVIPLSAASIKSIPKLKI